MSASRPTKKQKEAGGGAKVTPMLAQYLEIKSQHPDALLLFRMGDFYETFFEDAQVLSRVAGVTLTSRDAKSEHPVPLAGVPHHALETYLTRCLQAGLTVAICDQVEDPALARGLVKREVVQIISPGTATSPELVSTDTGHYCLAWVPSHDGEQGWALLDASTGEFRCGQEHGRLESLCHRHPVKEVIVREGTAPEQLNAWRTALPDVVINTVNDAWFHPSFARRTLLDHFSVANLAAFGLEEESRVQAVTAAGSVLRYLGTLTLDRPAQVTTLHFSSRGDRLVLDEETLRNLEVFRTFRGETGPGTLVHHVDETLTPMGRRFLELRLAVEFCRSVPDDTPTPSPTASPTPTRTPILERLVDDLDPGFRREGTQDGWHEMASGYGGHLWWVEAQEGPVSRWGEWLPELDGCSLYSLEVFLPQVEGATSSAHYEVSHAAGVREKLDLVQRHAGMLCKTGLTRTTSAAARETAARTEVLRETADGAQRITVAVDVGQGGKPHGASPSRRLRISCAI